VIVLDFENVRHGTDDGRAPLLCSRSKLSCVLHCMLDMAASSGGVETVSRVYRFEVFELHRYVVAAAVVRPCYLCPCIEVMICRFEVETLCVVW
jgi:hypothetical protein